MVGNVGGQKPRGPRVGLVVLSLGVLGALCLGGTATAQQGPSRAPQRLPQGARPDASVDDQYNYISGLFEQGFHDLVISESRKFLAANAGHARAPSVRYRLGQSLFESKKYGDARAELSKLEPAPRDFQFAIEVSFRLGQCALELDDPAEAARRFDAIAAAEGDAANHYLVPAAAFHAGEAHFRANEFAAAAKAYGRAAKGNDPEYAKNGLYGLGWSLYKAGEFETAASSLKLFVQKYPQDAAAGEAQFLLGECRLKQGQPAEALAAFQKVPPGEWQDDALSAAGFACAALKDDAKAATWFLRLEQATPDSPLLAEARLHAGIHLQRAGRDDEAAAILDRLLKGGGGDAGAFAGEACYWRGVVERKRGGAQNAQAAKASALAAVPFFERGLATKPAKELEQRLALARADALFDAGEFEAAKEAYAKAGGGSEEAAYSSAVAALNGNDYPGAVVRAKDFLARYAKGKHAAAANLVLGEALFAQEQWSAALPAFDAAASGDSRPRALSRGGWCCFKLARFPDATQRFAALVAEFPQDERAPEASFMAGRAALRGGDAKTAEATLTQHLKQFGNGDWDDDARYDLAQCKRALGKEDEAQKLLAQLARGGAKVDSALARRAAFETAEVAAAQGRHDEALAALAPIVGGDTPIELLRPALYAQAWSLFSLARHDEAAQALARLLATGDSKKLPLPKEVAAPALELQVSIARARKDGASARAAYDQLAQVAPEGERTPEVALVAALALDESGDPAGAAALLDGAAKRWPQWSGRDRLWYQRALSLQKAGDAAQAQALFARIESELAQSPLAAKAAFELGERAYDAGDFDGALAHYTKAGKAETGADAALYKAGWCRFQKQQFAEAAETFAQIPQRFEKSPLAGEARYLAGESLYRAGRFERAAEQLAEFAKLHPRHEQRAKALFRLGLACGELGRMDECFDALTKLQRDFPEFELRPESDLWLGRALLARKRTNDALAKFDAVIQADRSVLAARAHLGRGDVLIAQGRLDDALGEYLKVSLLFSSEPEVARSLWQAGQCLEQMGDKEKAKARYRELVDRHTKAAESEAARARLKELETAKSF